MALLLNLWRLGALGFHADEDLSAFAARAAAAGDPPRMPSGMLYRRAQLLTLLMAASARLFDPGSEFAYRLPVALLTAAAVPLVYAVGRRFGGPRLGLLAALMFATSEWVLVFGRQARMYGPLVFFGLAALHFFLRWTEQGRARDAVLAIASFALAVSLHPTAVLLLAATLIPYPLGARRAVRFEVAAGVVGAACAAGLLYDRLFVGAPYRAWRLPEVLTAAPKLPMYALLEPTGPGFSPELVVVLAGSGALLGIWAAMRLDPLPDRIPPIALGLAALGRLALGAVGGALAGLGQLPGAGLCFLLTALIDPPRGREMRRAALPLAALAGLAVLVLAFVSVQRGVDAALRSAITLPFPYLALLLAQSPGVTGLFLIGAVANLVWAGRRASVEWRSAAIAVLGSALALGLVEVWGPTRYLIVLYPLVVLGASATLLWSADALTRRRRASLVLAVGVVVSGLLGGVGAPAVARVAGLDYRDDVDPLLHMFPFRPDHVGAGRYLAARVAAGDVVVAEDPVQLRWYAGRADVWLRGPGFARPYLYRDGEGRLRDIYTSAVLAGNVATLDSVVRGASGTVWLVTSGETAHQRDLYLSPAQRAWLARVEATRGAAFTGRDGATRVYRLVEGAPR